jgi:ribosomal-protein-alanine N-acetyltransferase
LLCVQPAQRRRGIARALYGWLVDSARVAGMASIQLELRADNTAALAFYQHLGFVETQTVPDYYVGRLAARRMRQRLRPDADASTS